MSSIGENVHLTPQEAASTAATRAPLSTNSGSKVAASPSGIGNMVLKPCMTSLLTRIGIPSRLLSTAAFWILFISAGSTQLRMEPTSPFSAASVSQSPPESWFI